jgi:surface protein
MNSARLDILIKEYIINLFCIFLFVSCSIENNEDIINVRDPIPIQTQIPEVSNYTLSVIAGVGGDVSLTSGTYESGSDVTITASPKIGFMFVGWSGTFSGLNQSITLTINENTSITANFEPLIYLAENGISIKAKSEASIGLTEFNGQTYEIVSENKLREMVENGEDLSRVITSKVNNMDILFRNSNAINGDISHWDVSNVLYMRNMFRGISFSPPISNWDVSNLLYADEMFIASEFNSDISSWDVSNLISASAMFMDSNFNGDISNWDVSNVINMRLMFGYSSFNQSLNNWDVSSVENMSLMFGGINSVFNADISAWDVSNVRDMNSMFLENLVFNQDISAWDVSSVKNLQSMFWHSVFNGDISAWDVSNVENMSAMFSGSQFNGDISAWDVSSVTNMERMFNDVCCDQETGERFITQFNQDISNWDVSSVTNMERMFSSNIVFNQDLSSWNVSNVIKCQSFCNNTTWTLPKPTFTKCFGGSCD